MSKKVFRLGEDDLPEVVDVLTESFLDYPVMRFILDPAAPSYEPRLRTLVRFFAMARVLRKEALLGIGDRESLDGAALVSRPAGPASPPELGDLRERVWAELGGGARGRYEACGATWSRFEVEVPHIHLNMIGVRRRAQGTGLGRRLIEHVHLMSRDDSESQGVTLATEDPGNVPIYEHLGYRVTGHAIMAPGLESWGFFRPDGPLADDP